MHSSPGKPGADARSFARRFMGPKVEVACQFVERGGVMAGTTVRAG
jgi:hypothetical protein